MEGLERGGKPNPDVTINSGVGVQRTDDEAQGLKKKLRARPLAGEPKMLGQAPKYRKTVYYGNE